MEVRGGGCCIQKWSDAHLGPIRDGTGDIVALDVLQAIRITRSAVMRSGPDCVTRGLAAE